jgi:hypothetical protein
MTGAKSAAAFERVAAVRGKRCAGEGKNLKMPAKTARTRRSSRCAGVPCGSEILLADYNFLPRITRCFRPSHGGTRFRLAASPIASSHAHAGRHAQRWSRRHTLRCEWKFRGRGRADHTSSPEGELMPIGNLSFRSGARPFDAFRIGTCGDGRRCSNHRGSEPHRHTTSNGIGVLMTRDDVAGRGESPASL